MTAPLNPGVDQEKVLMHRISEEIRARQTRPNFGVAAKEPLEAVSLISILPGVDVSVAFFKSFSLFLPLFLRLFYVSLHPYDQHTYPLRP